MPKFWDGKTLPDALAAAATDAAKRAALGSRRAVYLQTVQSRIGAGAARETWRDGVKVREAVLAGVLPISGLRIDVPAPTSEQLQGAVALLRPDNEPAEIVHYIRSAVNPGDYVAIPVGGPTAATPGRLVSDLASGQPMTYAAMTLEPPPLDGIATNPTPAAATLTSLAVTSLANGSASVSVVVGGTLPQGARVLLQVTADPANGPWQESDRPVATLGTFTRVFPGLAAGTYYTRAFLFQDNGGPTDVIYATTALVGFEAGTVTFERILPIGDSITNGSLPGDNPPYYSWRGAFQSLMTAAGRAFDMIGPNTTGLGGGADPDSAAWGGASIDNAGGNSNNITDRLGLIFTAGIDPTTIVLYIGWNEMWVPATEASAAARWTTLFNTIRATRPSARIIVCTLHVPSDGSRRTGQIALNNAIRAAAAADPVSVKLADLDLLPMVPTDYADYLHLSDTGDNKIAQAIYNTAFGTATAPTTVVDDMVAQMGPNAPGAAPILLPPNAGWSGGGAVIAGGDTRGVARPSWWRYSVDNPLPQATIDLVNNYEWWDYLYPWFEIWDRAGHADGLNARVAVDWIELWARYASGWVRMARASGAALYSANDDAGAFYVRGGGSAAFGQKGLLADGSLGISLVPAGRQYHGWGAGAQVDGPNLITFQVRAQVRLALANPAGADDRGSAQYSAHVGCDPYPRGGTGFGMQPYNPGAVVSRWERVTNTPKVLYGTPFGDAQAGGPTHSQDRAFNYLPQQIITEAAFRANPPPLA